MAKLSNFMPTWLLISVAFLPQTLIAADEFEVRALAAQMDRIILPAGQSPFTGNVIVDPSDLTTIIFASPRQSLIVSLTSPSGSEYIVESADRDGVHSFVFPDRDKPDLTGLNYAFQISTPEVGTWGYRIEDNVSRNKAFPVFITAASDSDIIAAVLGGGRDYSVAVEMNLAAFVMDGDAFISDYVLTGTIRHESEIGIGTALAFVDDGGRGDELAGDGVRVARFTPSLPGHYQFKGLVTGQAGSGLTFARNIETSFRSVSRFAQLFDSIQDRGIDNDGNGFFEFIGISLPVEVADAGEYSLQLELVTISGARLVANAIEILPPGSQSMEVLIDTELLRGIGDDGPYQVDNALLRLITEEDLFVVDFIENVGLSSVWSLSEFERDAIETLGVLDSVGNDTNGNNLFNSLTVTLGLDILESGFYNWSASLVDKNGTELGFAAGAGNLSGQTSILMNFPGLPIGENGINGPFFVRNLVIFSSSNSAIVSSAGETAPFLASQFEGFIEPDTIPPSLTLMVSPSVVKIPNHKMFEVEVSYVVSDNIDPSPVVTFVSVNSSDGQNEIGDGNHSPDIEITEDGRIFLRAERSGRKPNRIYTITYSAQDSAGNIAESSAEVTVLHDNSRKRR